MKPTSKRLLYVAAAASIVILLGAVIAFVISGDNPAPASTDAEQQTSPPSNPPVSTNNSDEVTIISFAPDEQDAQTAAIASDQPYSVPIPAIDATRLVVTLQAGITADEKAALINALNATILDEIEALNAVVIRVPDGVTPDQVLALGGVSAAEPDFYVAALETGDSDPYLADQWALASLEVPALWEKLPADAATISVAVIDSGVCQNHEDLQGRADDGWDFVDNDANPDDVFGHGCAVSGVIAANMDNGVGIAGVAPNAQIMPLRVLNEDGLGYHSTVAQAIVYAVDNGAEILNLSLGSVETSMVLQNAVNYAIARDVDVVAAAGNTGQQEILYPAAYAPVITVGSVDRTLEPSLFSSFGPQIDVLAPGRSIRVLQGEDEYAWKSGTSYAAAFVSGTLALKAGVGETPVFTGSLLNLKASVVAVSEPTIRPDSPPETAVEAVDVDASALQTNKPTSEHLSSELDQLAILWAERAADASAFAETSGLEIENERVKVMITAQDADAGSALVESIPEMGGEVIAHYEVWIDAWIPVQELQAVADLPGVSLIERPIALAPADAGSVPPSDPLARVGAHTTQGLAASNANAWQTFGYDGTDVKVAVLDKFQNYTGAQGAGELPAVSTYGTLDTTSLHGTAIAEVIYDMAPGVSFTFASPTSPAQMAQYITDLAAAGNDIIVSSLVFYLNEPGDGTGPISSAINTAHTTYGTLYIQAGGNLAQRHWDGVFNDNNGDGIMDFPGAGAVNAFTAPLSEGTNLQIYMRWNSWPTTDQDYDLYLIRHNGVDWDIQFPVAFSESVQNGSQPPRESINYTIPGGAGGLYGLVVVKSSATGSQVLDIAITGSTPTSVPPLTANVSDRSLVDPATAQYSFSVAAVNVFSPFDLESYSSWGPTHGAGGALAGGLNKPRIAGYTNVDTWAYGGGTNFTGTSAAAAHVAGAAALILSASPLYTPEQIMADLEAKSIDMGAAGYDFQFGAGRLFLGEADPPLVEEDTNIVVNGDFSNGMNSWVTGGDMQTTIGAGVLNFVRNASLGNGWSLILQQLDHRTLAEMPFEIKVDLGNSSSTTKQVSVYLHELGTWENGTLGCVFSIPGNTPRLTYTIRGVVHNAWANIALEINSLTPDVPPNYLLLDNVDVQYKPSLGSIPDTCLAPMPEDINIARNGEFDQGTNEWTIAGDMVAEVISGELNLVRDAGLGNGWSLILQPINYPADAGWPFQVKVDLSNPTNDLKVITVYLHEVGTWDDGALGCVFNLLPGSPRLTYTLQGLIPNNWDNVTLEINSLSPDTVPNYVHLDSVDVRYQPGLGSIPDTCDIPIPTDINLVRNGDFSDDTNLWSIAGDITALVQNEVFNFVRDTSLGNGWSLILQELNATVEAGSPFEMTVDIENPTDTTKNFTIYLHEANNWGLGALGCMFAVQANSPQQTYTVRGTIPNNWNNTTLEINSLSPDTPPNFLLVDNIDVRYKPSLGSPPDECVIPVPADTNLVRNGDFDADNFNFWSVAGDMQAQAQNGQLNFLRNASFGQGWSLILQSLSYPANSGWPFEINVDLGNTTSTAKNVTIYLHEIATWDLGGLGCVFTLPANSPTLSYTIRGTIPNNWSNITIEINSLDPDAPPNWLLMDNIDVQYKPSLGNPSDECIIPVPANTNLVRNGNFNNGLNEWVVAGDMIANVNAGVVNFVHDSSLGNGFGFILQMLNYPAIAGLPYEVNIDLGNDTGSEKVVAVYLHETGTWENGTLGCVFNIPANSTLGTYIIRGTIPNSWANTTLEINSLSPDTQGNNLLMDNVDVQYKPSLGSPPTSCLIPVPQNTNLLRNGTFDGNFNFWAIAGDMQAIVDSNVLNFVRDSSLGNGWSLILQGTGYSVDAGWPFEVSVDLGNTTGEAKTVFVYLHESGTWDEGSLGCFFTIPSSSPLQTFIVQGNLPAAWDNITLEINSLDPDTAPNYLLMDNVDLQYQPGLGSIPLTCANPAQPPQDTNLVQNGTFNDGETGWSFNNVNHFINVGTLVFYAPSQTDNGVFQDLGYVLETGSKVQLQLQISNISEDAKDVIIVLEDAGGAETLFCTFTLSSGSPMATYTLESVSTVPWSEMRVRITDGTVGLEGFVIDNITAMYDPDLTITETVCTES